MPKKAPELPPIKVRRLSEKAGFHAVGGVAGLYLDVNPPRASSWILRVKIGDKRRDIGLGGYPDVTLEQARDKAREAREQIAKGIDPVEAKKAAKASLALSQAMALTFKQAAHACHKAKVGEFRNEKHRADWINSLERYAFPAIGDLPVAEIDLPHIVTVLEPIWAEKTETATRVRQRIESVLAWATVNKYRTGDNPARWKGNLEHALAKPSKVRKRTRHHPAVPLDRMGAFMADLRTKQGIGARALEFAILTAARSSEVRGATWDEIDLRAKVWSVPADRIKGHKLHRVPLSPAAVALLKKLPRFEGTDLVFPSPVKGVELSDMTLAKVIKDLHDADVARGGAGYFDPIQKAIATPHGTARSTFKDWARTYTKFADEVSELALAHVNSDATRAAYARDELLTLRTKLMKDWATFCATVRTRGKGKVIPLRAHK